MKNYKFLGRHLRLLMTLILIILFGFDGQTQTISGTAFQFTTGGARGMFASGSRGISLTGTSGGGIVGDVFLASGVGRVNLGSANSGPYRMLVRPIGANNNIAHLESGTFGNIFSTTSKWLGLGSAPAGVGASVYGKRIQWGQNFGIFNLRQVTTSQRDLVIQWGGTTSNNRLLFEYATGPTATPSLRMSIANNGRVTVNSGDFQVGVLEIDDKGSNNLGLDGDVVPFNSTAFDLGNNTAGQFWDDVVGDQFIGLSDRRLKRDIHSMDYGLKELMQLRPVMYHFKDDMAEEKEKIGLIAQELEEIIPEAVKTHEVDLGEDGQMVRTEAELWGIDYGKLSVVLIKSMQDQQAMIVEQQEELRKQRRLIRRMRAQLVELLGDDDNDDDDDNRRARLLQNDPNPFSGETKIKFFLPEGTRNAKLMVYDMQGNPVDQFDISARGNASFSIKRGKLKNGIYLYALVADGKEVGVKRMIIGD